MKYSGALVIMSLLSDYNDAVVPELIIQVRFKVKYV